MIEMNISDSHNSTRLTVVKIAANTGLSSLGVPGVPWHTQILGRSVNPISTSWDRLCPLNYYWHTRIFRPSDGPVPHQCKQGVGAR